jgi:tellurite resistance protein TehA-like permease
MNRRETIWMAIALSVEVVGVILLYFGEGSEGAKVLAKFISIVMLFQVGLFLYAAATQDRKC